MKEQVGNTAVYIGNNIYNKKVNSRKRGVHNIYGLTGNANHLVEVNPVLRFYLHLCLFGLSGAIYVIKNKCNDKVYGGQTIVSYILKLRKKHNLCQTNKIKCIDYPDGE